MQVVSLRKATCTKGIRLPSFVACAYPEKKDTILARKDTCKGIRIVSLFLGYAHEKRDTIRIPSFVGTKQVSLRKETSPFEGILALFQQRKEYGCASKGILLVSLFCSNNKRDTDAETKGYFLYPFFVLTTKGIQMRKQRDTSCIPSLF